MKKLWANLLLLSAITLVGCGSTSTAKKSDSFSGTSIALSIIDITDDVMVDASSDIYSIALTCTNKTGNDVTLDEKGYTIKIDGSSDNSYSVKYSNLSSQVVNGNSSLTFTVAFSASTSWSKGSFEYASGNEKISFSFAKADFSCGAIGSSSSSVDAGGTIVE